jgi:hypothetical protein
VKNLILSFPNQNLFFNFYTRQKAGYYGHMKRSGLTLVELLLSLFIFLLFISTLTFILFNPLKLTFNRLQTAGTEIRLWEGLRQMQNDLFFAHQVKIAGQSIQGIAPDGQSFSYEQTANGLKRTLGPSTQYFTLPEDRTLPLTFSWQSSGLLKISYRNQFILQKVN